MPRLSGKVAIITGASGGIGRATAVELANEGADVVLQYMSRVAEAQALADKLAGMGRKTVLAHVNFTDLSESPGQVQEMVNATIREFGKVDVLVNLAGYSAKGEWNKKFPDLTIEDFYKPLNVDLFG
jgi:3-oxoacyl-[acyl-carrier protein] reductase